MPHISQEGAHIVRLRVRRLVSWPDDSSSTEEEEEKHEEGEEQEEAGPKLPSTNAKLEQGGSEEGPKPSRQRRSRDWGSTMEEEECLTFDDPWSDSDATADGRSPTCSTPWELGSPGETAVEVHARESEVEEL